MRLRFERYFILQPDDGRSISGNVASLNILVHDVINLLYYKGFLLKKKKMFCKSNFSPLGSYMLKVCN